MKFFALTIVTLLLAFAGPVTQAATWQTDFAAAQAQAQRENKALLVDFTGSDWCGWCIKLKKEIFSQPQFEAYANQHLVLVEIDFPRQTQLPMARKKANSQLADKYKVSGFPTVIVFSGQGKELGRLGYMPGGPAPFLQSVGKLTGVAAPAPPPAAAAATEAAPPPPAPKRPPLFGGAAGAPPQRYDGLTLKSISGTKQRPFALVNNQTFAPGEAAQVKLGDSTVNVHCLQIREKSVLVLVQGEQSAREIQLGNP